MDEVRKQYLIFSSIISVFISYLLVYILFPLAKSIFFSGSIINITNDEAGLAVFIEGFINYVVVFGIVTSTIYFTIQWFLNRA